MDQYRVFGHPIKHSKSPLIHTWFAQETTQELNYQSQLVPLDGFESSLLTFQKAGGKGINITAPFKEQAFQLCHQLSDYAKKAGAVNTISCIEGQFIGDNTDGIGLVTDLLQHHVELSGKNVLILGAGGAAKGVVLPILEQQPKSLTIANRTVSKAQAIANNFNQYNVLTKSFEQLTSAYDIIINATSAGLSETKLAISDDIFSSQSVCYDMVYSKELTPFLKHAQQLNVALTLDGLGMLVEQAAESFRLWRGIKPNTQAIIDNLRQTIIAE